MSDNEGGESRGAGAIVLGLVLGVLLCVGAGGAVLWRMGERAKEEAMRAQEAERQAQDQLREARERQVKDGK